MVVSDERAFTALINRRGTKRGVCTPGTWVQPALRPTGESFVAAEGVLVCLTGAHKADSTGPLGIER